MLFFDNLLESIPYLNTPFGIKIIKSLLTIALLSLLRILIQQFILKRISDVKSHYQGRKILNSITFILGLVIVGRLWYDGVQSLLTYLGLVSAGIAIALKDPIVNFAGWIYILSRKPFEVSNRIQLGEYSGDVIDISTFQISILEIGNWVDADQSTGRIVHIPNGKIFTHELANYDKGFKYIWNEIRVVVTFESNWKAAKKLLLEIANNKGENISIKMDRQIKQAAQKYMIYYKKLTPIVYTDVKDHGIQLSIRHLCESRKRRGYTEAIWEDILTEFAKHDDIDLAYPTTRFYTTDKN